jgi:hypothetical protein
MEKFKFIGGEKISSNPIIDDETIYQYYVRSGDLNDIADKLNEIIDITDNHISATIASNNTLGHVKVDNNTIKINDKRNYFS